MAWTSGILESRLRANTNILSLGTNGVIVNANKKIKPGDEVNYGQHYFGQNNEEFI